MWQILSSFFLDATAYVARRMSMSRFFDWLRDYRINTCTFPEPALKAFPPSDADKDLALKFVYAFGWRPESKREAQERFDCHARDAYGMTELGTATTTPIHAGEKNFERTCGMPTPDRRLKVVGEDGQVLPRGEVGELWVSGPGIMWGYYKRPQANADVFRGKWFAVFKRPRYIAYIDDFPRTPTGKIAKHRLIDRTGDLRADAFDVVDEVWR